MSLRVLAACVALMLLPSTGNADTLTLAWDANPEVDVMGYYVYIGTVSGSYSTAIDVGNVTSYTISDAMPGATYFLTVAAYAPGPVVGTQAPELVASVAATGGGNSGTIGGASGAGDPGGPRNDTSPAAGSVALAPSRGHAAPADSIAPTLALVSPPTNAAGYVLTDGFITLTGTATDNVGVQSVTWISDRGGSGDVAGTTNWSVVIPLQTGTNVITVTALDASANLTVAKLTVTVATPSTTPAPTRPTQRRRFSRS